MKHFILGLIFSLLILSSYSQKGFCKITKVVPHSSSKGVVTFKFINPQGKPAKSRVAFKINNDSLVQPDLSSEGTFEMKLKPGTYTFNFFVKFWYDIDSKPITIKPKTNTNLLIKFEAVEIGTTPVK